MVENFLDKCADSSAISRQSLHAKLLITVIPTTCLTVIPTMCHVLDDDTYHVLEALKLLKKENLPDKLALHFGAAVCLEIRIILLCFFISVQKNAV